MEMIRQEGRGSMSKTIKELCIVVAGLGGDMSGTSGQYLMLFGFLL